MSRSQRHTPLQFIQEASTIQHHYQYGSRQVQVPSPTTTSHKIGIREACIGSLAGGPQRSIKSRVTLPASTVLSSLVIVCGVPRSGHRLEGLSTRVTSAGFLPTIFVVSGHRVRSQLSAVVRSRPFSFGRVFVACATTRILQRLQSLVIASVPVVLEFSQTILSLIGSISGIFWFLVFSLIKEFQSAILESSASRQDPSWSHRLQASRTLQLCLRLIPGYRFALGSAVVIIACYSVISVFTRSTLAVYSCP